MIRDFREKIFNKFFKLSGILGLLIFINFLIISSLFLHIHISPIDGIIVHSHVTQPHNNDPAKESNQHKHSPIEYLFYHNLSNIGLLLIYLFILSFILKIFSPIFLYKLTFPNLLISYEIIPRAPPTV